MDFWSRSLAVTLSAPFLPPTTLLTAPFNLLAIVFFSGEFLVDGIDGVDVFIAPIPVDAGFFFVAGFFFAASLASIPAFTSAGEGPPRLLFAALASFRN